MQACNCSRYNSLHVPGPDCVNMPIAKPAEPIAIITGGDLKKIREILENRREERRLYDPEWKMIKALLEKLDVQIQPTV